MAESAAQELVTLIKQNGKKFPDNHAVVSEGRIFVENAKLPIERGDYLVRLLPGGLEEIFSVVNPGFCPSIGTFKAHFQVQVVKTDAVVLAKTETGPQPVKITSGPTRLNALPPKELFLELRKIVFEKFPQKEHTQMFLAVDAMEKALGTDGFKETYKGFIKECGDLIGLMVAYIPELTKLL